MSILLLFLIFASFLFFIIFFQDIFPRCSVCKKIKFKPLIKFQRITGVIPGFRKNTAACRKCCKKYSVNTYKEFEQLQRIRKKLLNTSL